MKAVWKSIRFFVLLGLVSCLVPATTFGNPLLDAMSAELARNMEGLRLDGYANPYFIGYTITDHSEARIQARYGAVTERESERNRLAYVEVRVGDYSRDNTEDREGASYAEMNLAQAEIQVSLDDDENSIRTALWLLTDQRYKEALTAYHRVRGARVYRADTSAGSFTQEEAVHSKTEVKVPVFETQEWEKRLRNLSGQLAASPGIQDSWVEVTLKTDVRYQTNSEGTELLTQNTWAGFHVYVMALAEDGSLLEHGANHYARSQEGLPSQREMERIVEEVKSHLKALRKAPTLPPYTGPAILMPRAAGVLFHEAIGHRLEGHRQDDLEEGRTFAGRIGEQVLPAFISIRDDPTQAVAHGIPLNGHYAFDAEGVPAQNVTLIKNGVLRGYLMGRKPVKGVTSSNGHGRASGVSSPVGRMGNLIVEAEGGLSLEDLKKKLLQEIRTAKKPFGLIIGDVTGGSTNTMNYGFQAFKGGATHVLKVDAETGATQLVRGVEIVGTPLSTINKVVAASTESGVFNGYCGAESGYVPVGTIAPALLLREIELQRSVKSSQRGPVLQPPSRALGVQ